MDRNSRRAGEHGHDALQRVRREGRWWWLQARHTRRIWRWALLAAGVLFLALILLRRPLADWFWDEPQIEQLIEQGDRALADGRLNVAGGARESYQAALALDGDRSEARAGLARTAQAALQQAREALAGGDLEAAQRGLVLARELQVPQRDADQVAQLLRQRGSAEAGLAVLLGRAEEALQARRLDGTEDSALPLFQQVLAVVPNHLRALEGREDALSDLLQQARAACQRGDLAAAATLLGSARRYDPGHFDLPATQEAFNDTLEKRLQQGAQAVRQQRWDRAASDFQAVLAAAPDDQVARQGVQKVIEEQLAAANRLAGDFRFDQAEQVLAKAQDLGASERALAATRQALAQSRQAQKALASPGTPRAQRELRLRELLARIAEAEDRGQFLSPPGRSAYDALREAQAVARDDPRVRDAAKRLLPASRRCFEDRLRENRVQGAGACLDAWQALAPSDPALLSARRRLAQRWLAIGSERLGAGDLGFARQALDQARYWQPDLSELGGFERRLRDAGGPG
jgi:tetratricopeptide (TPR) repeat protein